MKKDIKTVFIFNTEDEDIIEKVISGTIPAGYYSIQEEWRLGQWGFTFYYFDIEQKHSDDTVFLGEFGVKEFKLIASGGLVIYY